MPALLFAAAAPLNPEVLAIRVLPEGEGRASIKVFTAADPGPVAARREGDEVVLVLPGDAAEGLDLPEVVPPLEGLRLVPEEGRLLLRARIAPEVPFEVEVHGAVVTLLVGERGLSELATSAELYPKLFPGAPAADPVDAGAEEAGKDEGVWVGRIRLRPGIVLSYVDADVEEFGTGQPEREQYFEVQPTLGANLGLDLLGGRVRASYEPRFRSLGGGGGSELGSTSHFVEAAVDLTVGQRLDLDARYHFSTGVLETTEVDPGREYFFFLGRYTHHDTGVEARFDLTPRLQVQAGADWNRVDVDQPASFVGYGQDRFRAGLGYETSPGSRIALLYERSRVPPAPDRPVIEGDAESAVLALQVDRGPALSARAEVAYRAQDNPRAEAPGQRFRGLNYAALLRRALGPALGLDVAAGRSTNVSSFEENAYYVSDSVRASLTVSLPGELALSGGVGWIWNRYALPAAATGAPRTDDVFGWTVGVGRPFGRLAFVRADYRRERRDSSIPGLDTVNHGFVAQVGIGLFVERTAR